VDRSGDLDVQIRPGEIPIIDVDGEIDHFAVPELEHKVMEFLDTGYASIILDFTDVSYIDSAGVALIILSIQKTTPLGGKVGLIVIDKNVLKILEIVGITKLVQAFAMYSSLEEALADMSGDKSG
jgi:anti-sigma B factor antagonist